MQRILGAAALLSCGLVASARGDGCVVPKAAVVRPVRTPDQKALLRFDGTTEALVIETTLQGEGHEFAWLLPLPAAPKIEASTTGLFPTLETICTPTVDDGGQDRPDPTWILVAAGGVGLWITVRWWRRPIPYPVAILVAPALVCASGLLFGWEQEHLYFKGGGAGPSPVTVRSREQVGVFDTAVLDARDAAGLRAWLDANGFRAPDGIDRVVDEYAKEGWVFVASKIRRDMDDDAARRIHPLCFTFPSAHAVYPMRLTGATNDSLALSLFVAGDRRAEVDGMDVERCDEGSFAERRRERLPDFRRFDGEYPITEELHRRCAGSTVLTKLTGVFDRDAMAQDLELRWVAFEEKKVVYLTADEATRRSRLPAAFGLAAGLAAAAVMGRRRAIAAGKSATSWDSVCIASALAIGVGVGCVAWRIAPRLPEDARIVTGTGYSLRAVLKDPPRSVRGDARAIREWARRATADCVNPWTGEPAREEDSDGNWFVREIDGRIELVAPSAWPWYGFVIDLSRLAILEGVVRTAEGAAVPGAWVRLTDVDNKPEPGTFFTYDVDVRSDGEGRYRLEFPCGRSWHLSVVHPEHPYLLRENADLRDPPAGPTDLVLPPGRTVRGRVIDREGRPVGGVDVHGDRKLPFETHDENGVCIATTAPDGTFQLKGLVVESGTAVVRLHVHRGGRCPGEAMTAVEVRPGGPPVNLRLDAW